MLTKQGLRVELALNNEQVTACLQHCGASRFAYNYGLKRKEEAYKAGQKSPSAIDLHREINLLKRDNPWMYEVSKCAFQEALRDLDNAFAHFFRKCKRKNRDNGKANVAILASNHARKVLAVLALPEASRCMTTPFTSLAWACCV